MQRLNTLTDPTETLKKPETAPRFWSRQFSNDVTSFQSTFDLIFGVIAPVLCFIFDPIVFNDRLGLDPFGLSLSNYKLLVYPFSGLSILTLSLWLILRKMSGSLSASIAGILLSGAVCSLVIGILILPLTLLGLMLFIGILGFIPFFTSLVYLRNGIRAFRAAKPFLDQPTRVASVPLGAALVIGLPLLLQTQANRIVAESMNDLLKGDVRAAESATRSLRYVGRATDLDQIVMTYSRETDQTRKDTLAKAYKELTGTDIQTRLAILLD